MVISAIARILLSSWAKRRATADEVKSRQAESDVQARIDANIRAQNLPEIQNMMFKFEVVFAEKFEMLMRQMLSEYRLAWIGRTLAGRREVPFAGMDIIDQLLECGRVWGESYSPERDAETAITEFEVTGHGDIVMLADLNAATRLLAVEAALASPEAYEKVASLVLERQASTANRVRSALEALAPTLDLTKLSA